MEIPNNFIWRNYIYIVYKFKSIFQETFISFRVVGMCMDKEELIIRKGASKEETGNGH